MHSSATGFYSGGHENSIRGNLMELLSLSNERDGLETLADVLVDSLKPDSLVRLADALIRRIAKS